MSGSAGTTGPTLRGVLDSLGPTLVQLHAAPRGLDVPALRVVIHDPTEPPLVEAGDVVLAVGAPGGGRGALELLSAAGGADASAVVLRLGSAVPDGLHDVAEASGVAVVGITADMAWSQVYTLLRTAISAAASSSAGPGDPPSLPIGDLFALANAIAALVGGPTTIEDRESTVLAFSSLDEPIDEHRRATILGRRVSARWRTRLEEDGIFHRLWSEPGPIRVDYPGEEPPLQPRLAVAVRAGGEILGSIWVAEGDRPFGDDAAAALVEAARIAALHLIRSRSFDDLERARRRDLLRSVLEGSTAPELLADALDIDADAFVTVLAFRVDPADPADTVVRTGRAADVIALHCEAFRRKAACIAIGSVIYVLVPDTAAPERERLVALATGVVERLQGALRTGVTVGIGATLAGLAQTTTSRRHADQVLGVVPDRGVVRTIEDVRERTILATLRGFARVDPELLAGKLERLARHDRDRRTSFLTTLRAYLDAFGDVPAAATAIDVHQNTFRYRLRRLVALAEIDLQDPVERLVLHLQLHLEDPVRP